MTCTTIAVSRADSSWRTRSLDNLLSQGFKEVYYSEKKRLLWMESGEYIQNFEIENWKINSVLWRKKCSKKISLSNSNSRSTDPRHKSHSYPARQPQKVLNTFICRKAIGHYDDVLSILNAGGHCRKFKCIITFKPRDTWGTVQKFTKRKQI